MAKFWANRIKQGKATITMTFDISGIDDVPARWREEVLALIS